MVRENKKTVLRTIRLSKGLDELLQKDANSKRITVGALISTILTKYSQWDRYTEKFEMITLRQETIKAILEATEDEALIRKAREIGAKIPKEFLMFWFKKQILNRTFNMLNYYVIMEVLRAMNLKLMVKLMLSPFFTTWARNGLYSLSTSSKKA
jgi:hypothetical protein